MVCGYFLIPSHADALKCMKPPAVEQAYDQYDGVVVAKVDEIASRSDHRDVALTVEQSFKGVKDEKLTIKEDMSWGTSEQGERYLFFLQQSDNGEWELPLCSPTMKAADAVQELDYLRDKEIWPDEAGTADQPGGDRKVK
ncbi:hypothetical protein [Paenibacillus sp. LHD-38]|uniref:hypothetical protein n=1 Tax=Paenibacillus sp. LHD-38 TaxID=3072143 RepID=UPI00280E79EA|nr:hypothetical protein [Paenibacillus sp. LHD-38]MDQ8737148.1 hypothetical protein [Paenibacillus sp. LHD-38]